MKIKIFLILFLSINYALAQNPNKLIRKGNKNYSDSLYGKAENDYRDALINDQNSFAASFNLADAIYKQEKFSESSTLFKALTEKAENKQQKAITYHNLGNSLLKEKKN